MLLTTCTTCAAQFKVLPEHLNVRQGRVMCGRCRTVFNAFETLKRVEDELPVLPASYFPSSAAASASSAPAASPYAQTMPPASSTSSYHLPEHEFSAPAATSTGWATRDDSTGRFTPLLETSYAEPAESGESDKIDEMEAADFTPAPVVEPDPVEATETYSRELPNKTANKFSALDDDIEDNIAPPIKPALNDQTRREPTMNVRDLRQLSRDPVIEPLLETKLESPLEFTSGPMSGPPMIATDPPDDFGPDTDARLQELKVSRRYLALCAVMAIVLAAQLVFYFRHSLAETYPQLRPALASACAVFGCRLSWARETAAIEVKGTELVEVPNKPGRMLANATFVNRGKVTQEYPAIELRLTDNTNQIVMSRILRPSDYVASFTSAASAPASAPTSAPASADRAVIDKGIAPNAEFALSLTFETPPKTAATGYEFVPFYP
jgi:predicted Zn finger-like uncharacterized protein